MTFNFTTPINFFGAYMGGLEGSLIGQETITINDGSAKTVNIPNLAYGWAFVGFTDTASFSSVTLNFQPGNYSDFVSVNDVSFPSNITVLHPFTGSPTDGANPVASLIQDSAGNLYGTTQSGGLGFGVVFEVPKNGPEKVLYSFTGGADGYSPEGTMALDPAGNLYGTTISGGASGSGVVFKLDANGNETVLYNFTGAADGGGPYAGLIRDSKGNLYGTTAGGGKTRKCRGGCGVVFEVDPAGAETVLHSFSGPDGALPYSGLTRDSAGNLYGVTTQGGASGYGVVFEVVKKTGKEKVLYSLTGGTDGALPYGTLVRNSAGDLYGVAAQGGSANGTAGYGVVFEVPENAPEKVLYTFTGGADGGMPIGSLVADPAGNLYGTTNLGGIASGSSGYGVVFELPVNAPAMVLYRFTGGADGAYPYGGMVLDSTGDLYGTTFQGGTANDGVVFKLIP